MNSNLEQLSQRLEDVMEYFEHPDLQYLRCMSIRSVYDEIQSAINKKHHSVDGTKGT